MSKQSPKHSLKIPSKTFLIGEYAVLGSDPGPAIVLNTSPTFEISLCKDKQYQFQGLDLDNALHQALMSLSYSIEFKDPYQNTGGFGRSGAEKITYQFIKSILEQEKKSHVLEPYYFLACIAQRFPGQESGVDILSQLTGKVAIIDKKNHICNQNNWPFDDLAWSIIKTKHKIATHQHLDLLQTESFEPLKLISQRCIDAFSKNDALTLIHCINAYQQTLVALKLCCPQTQQLIEQLQQADLFLAIKGCGALGADTVIVFYEKTRREQANAYFKSQHLDQVSTEQDLTTLSWDFS